jgi:acyl-CoA thioester hydrolase
LMDFYDFSGMIDSEVVLRVRYSETDRMGYVYYGNYAAYLEVARVEALRENGITYKDLEDRGVLLPVSEYKINYLKPAYYDDLLTIRTNISPLRGVRLLFQYELFNQSGDLIATAETTLVFVSSESGRPCSPPDDVLKLLSA